MFMEDKMKRYTKKVNNSYCEYLPKDPYFLDLIGANRKDLEGTYDCELSCLVDKLGQLEDLEKELGCPLDVVFKAMTMGIMIKNSDEFWEHNYSEYDEKYVYFSTEEISLKNWQCHGIDNVTNSFQINFGDDDEFCVYLKDYKRTWWLKGEKDVNL